MKIENIDNDNVEQFARIPARAFAREISYEEAEQVSGGIECGGSNTTACKDGKCEPDKGIDCTW